MSCFDYEIRTRKQVRLKEIVNKNNSRDKISKEKKE
jgi:hypothetical protein